VRTAPFGPTPPAAAESPGGKPFPSTKTEGKKHQLALEQSQRPLSSCHPKRPRGPSKQATDHIKGTGPGG
jgi:hypothetical protein